MHCYIEEQLKKLGLRKTRDRHKILELFAEDRTWTAAQIHEVYAEMDLSTIYRNLQKLTKKGFLSEIHHHAGEAHYERAKQSHHDHLVCESCDVIECVPCPAPSLRRHYLELVGICSSCK